MSLFCIDENRIKKHSVRRKLFESSTKKNVLNSSKSIRRNTKWPQSRGHEENRRYSKAKRRLNYENGNIKLFKDVIFNPVLEALKKHSLNMNGIGIFMKENNVQMIQNCEEFLRVPFYNDNGDRFNLDRVLQNDNDIEFIVGWMPVIKSVKVGNGHDVENYKSDRNVQTGSFSSGYDSRSDLLENDSHCSVAEVPLASSTPFDRRQMRKEYTYPDHFETQNYFSYDTNQSSCDEY